MKFTCEIEMENAAFERDPGGDLGRILRKLAQKAEGFDGRIDGGKVMDVNGNSVGTWGIS